ncbi:hypothetical protein BGZ97_002167 [Linnemannia gamsii]|uniref:ubiquitinyl hydrolase 1 n=1 Tax=Linnemannia gamsii TaxID=64522 RepID=A0A9P6UIF7_9FUNG|nr:hypothetical protein BGZ97_002167 [Linnemannia gamsii]
MTTAPVPSSTITPPSSSSRSYTAPTTTSTTATAPISTSASASPTSTVTNTLFQRTPSIRIKKDKKKSSKGDKDRDRSSVDNHIHLKRSRSPIKLIRNIKSYLHVHKHKNSPSSSSSSSANNTLLSSTSANGSLAPPSRNSFDGASSNQYRSTSLPSSSILSAAASQLVQEDPTTATAGQSRLSKERQRSESMDPEKQVLLLRVMSYFEHAGHRADEETAEYLLSSYQWNIDHTLQYCQDLLQAVHGTLVPVQQEIVLGGAVNDQMTSCYIDALLFAMFARLSAFEGLLNVNLDAESDSDSEESGTGAPDTGPSKKDEERLHTHRLQTWLRMFVNQLRSGRLIQAHVVKELRQHLYCCGWHCPGPMDPPGSSRQEDSSELFMFLTEKLHLPYLPLEQRLLHGAKSSADDDKVITERMLQISIPTPDQSTAPESPQSKLGSTFSKLMSSPKTTSSDSNGNVSSQAESSMLEVLLLENLLAQYFYDNTLTGIRRRVSSGTGVPLSPGVEIPVSAWQVLELLPFYSSSNEQGGVIHASQSQYPSGVVILPLILKRYSFGPDMQARRIGTPIVIPRRIDFSRFVNPQTTAPPPPRMAANVGASSESTQAPAPEPAPEPTRVPESEPVHGARPASIDTTATTTVLPPLSIPDNRPTLGASSSVQGLSAISINTQVPPIRKYSMSLLQPTESPRTPITPPPQYSPSQGRTGSANEYHDDKRGWSPLPRENSELTYMDYSPPKVKYMLELKSVVCHVGYRLDSGHYRSYVANTVSNNSGAPHQHPLAFQEPNWLRHDDLDPSGRRVQLITRDSPEDMDMEADWARNGYILFYELQTIQC